MIKQLVVTMICAVCFAGMCLAQNVNEGVSALTPERAAAPEMIAPPTTGAQLDKPTERVNDFRRGAIGSPSLGENESPGLLSRNRPIGSSPGSDPNPQESNQSPEENLLSTLASGENLDNAASDFGDELNSDPARPSNQGDEEAGSPSNEVAQDSTKGSAAQKTEGEAFSAMWDTVNTPTTEEEAARDAQFNTFNACIAGNVHVDKVFNTGMYLHCDYNAMLAALFQKMNNDMGNADSDSDGILDRNEMLQYTINYYQDEANIVAAIAEAAPDKAAAIAATGARTSHGQAAAIAAAVATAVDEALPGQAATIAAAVAEALPSQAAAIAAAVAEALPGQAAAIAVAVAEVVPSEAVAIAKAVSAVVPSQTVTIFMAVKNAGALTDTVRNIISDMLETFQTSPDADPPYQG